MDPRAETIPDLEQRLLAGERLLSTLIVVLSTRDPGILDELDELFANPEFAADEAGRAATQVWRRVAQDLARTRTLVAGNRSVWTKED